MIPDLLDGRASPFSRVHTFELNMDRPSSSFVIPPHVMAYLFSGSPAFDFHEWEGMKRVYKTSFINEKCNTIAIYLPEFLQILCFPSQVQKSAKQSD